MLVKISPVIVKPEQHIFITLSLDFCPKFSQLEMLSTKTWQKLGRIETGIQLKGKRLGNLHQPGQPVLDKM